MADVRCGKKSSIDKNQKSFGFAHLIPVVFIIKGNYIPLVFIKFLLFIPLDFIINLY
jgi:hypothetical protein